MHQAPVRCFLLSRRARCCQALRPEVHRLTSIPRYWWYLAVHSLRLSPATPALVLLLQRSFATFSPLRLGAAAGWAEQTSPTSLLCASCWLWWLDVIGGAHLRYFREQGPLLWCDSRHPWQHFTWMSWACASCNTFGIGRYWLLLMLTC